MIRERDKIERIYRCDIPGCPINHRTYISADDAWRLDCPDGWQWVSNEQGDDPKTDTLFLCPEHKEYLGIVRLLIKLFADRDQITQP